MLFWWRQFWMPEEAPRSNPCFGGTGSWQWFGLECWPVGVKHIIRYFFHRLLWNLVFAASHLVLVSETTYFSLCIDYSWMLTDQMGMYSLPCICNEVVSIKTHVSPYRYYRLQVKFPHLTWNLIEKSFVLPLYANIKHWIIDATKLFIEQLVAVQSSVFMCWSWCCTWVSEWVERPTQVSGCRQGIQDLELRLLSPSPEWVEVQPVNEP